MTHARTPLVFGILALTAAGAAAAMQMQMPSIPSVGGISGMGGLPNIGNIGAGNAAGVLGYCMKNNLLGGSNNASSITDSLLKKPGVTDSKEFAAGQAGNILTGDATGGGAPSSFSLGSVSDPIKSQACNMVLKQAGKFL